MLQTAKPNKLETNFSHVYNAYKVLAITLCESNLHTSLTFLNPRNNFKHNILHGPVKSVKQVAQGQHKHTVSNKEMVVFQTFQILPFVSNLKLEPF